MKSSEMINLTKNHYRRVFQLFFFLFTVYAWVRLYLFVSHFDKGWPYVDRPVSIEAFLPIGALVSLKNLILNRFIDPVHPAALVIFMAVITSAVVFRRGFCGWVCPIGFISEMLTLAGERLGGRTFLGTDYLKVLKYGLLIFFLALILPMSADDAAMFLFSPYWAIADVKLLDFWLKPGNLTVIVTMILIFGTLLVKNLWCRFVCPYGALIGILSLASPARIEKNGCTGCAKCDEACPAGIKISHKNQITTPDCIMCLECISACKYGYLKLKFAGVSVKKVIYYPTAIAAILFGFFAIAKLTGNWDSILRYEDYEKLLKVRDFISH